MKKGILFVSCVLFLFIFYSCAGVEKPSKPPTAEDVMSEALSLKMREMSRAQLNRLNLGDYKKFPGLQFQILKSKLLDSDFDKIKALSSCTPLLKIFLCTKIEPEDVFPSRKIGVSSFLEILKATKGEANAQNIIIKNFFGWNEGVYRENSSYFKSDIPWNSNYVVREALRYTKGNYRAQNVVLKRLDNILGCEFLEYIDDAYSQGNFIEKIESSSLYAYQVEDSFQFVKLDNREAFIKKCLEARRKIETLMRWYELVGDKYNKKIILRAVEKKQQSGTMNEEE